MSLRLNTLLPDLSGATEWLNGQPDHTSLIGQPVLVHLWSISCHICHENMPTIARWRDLYSPRGLRVIAVHIPRAEQELDPARVRAMASAMGLTEPCAMDNHHAIKAAFRTAYVPAYFLFDREGKLRSRSGGDVGLALLEQALKRQFLEPVPVRETNWAYL